MKEEKWLREEKKGGGNANDTWTVQKVAQKYGPLVGFEKKALKELMNGRSRRLTKNMERSTGITWISVKAPLYS